MTLTLKQNMIITKHNVRTTNLSGYPFGKASWVHWGPLQLLQTKRGSGSKPRPDRSPRPDLRSQNVSPSDVYQRKISVYLKRSLFSTTNLVQIYVPFQRQIKAYLPS